MKTDTPRSDRLATLEDSSGLNAAVNGSGSLNGCQLSRSRLPRFFSKSVSKSGYRLFASTLIALLLVPAAYAGYGDALNMPVGVTSVSREVYGLHMLIFKVCVVIGVAVFGVMIYSMVMHRKSKGAKPATFHESTTVEIIWTVTPFIILLFMAWPAAKVLIKMEDFSGSEMTVKITAYQWRWHYDYIDEGVEYYSQLDAEHNVARQKGAGIELERFDNYIKEVDNPLVLPVGKKIRFLHTAADVIHAWWVPALAVKKDSIPGFINENWALIEEPGTYRGKCAELCGRDHGFMPIVVKAVPQEEYDAFIQGKLSEGQTADFDTTRQWGKSELMARGEEVYGRNCIGCHQAEGQGIAGMFPAIAGSDVATGDIVRHLQTVMNGVEGTPMQSYSDVLSDIDLASVITFQRNALGNEMGDVLQPYYVDRIRKGLDLGSAVAATEPDVPDFGIGNQTDSNFLGGAAATGATQ